VRERALEVGLFGAEALGQRYPPVHVRARHHRRCLLPDREQQLTSKLLGGFVAGLVMTGLGLLLGFGGVALAIVDAITD